MKVTLDACLFGAIIPTSQATSILDIGSGTGLLSLMSAQRSSGKVCGVEIDPAAVTQSRANVKSSPFEARTSIIHSDIQSFAAAHLGQSNPPFDCIITNPPFFSDSLKGPDQARNCARHNDHLSFSDLCQVIASLLAERGVAWVLLPNTEETAFIDQAKHYQLTLCHRITFKVKPSSAFHRVVLGLKVGQNQENTGANQPPFTEESLTIYDANDQYSPDFRLHLKPFYLKL